MNLTLAHILDSHTNQQGQRTTAAIFDLKQRRVVGNIRRIVSAKDIGRRYHTNMHWCLSTTMLLASEITLLVTCIGVQTTYHISTRHAHQSSQNEEQHH